MIEAIGLTVLGFLAIFVDLMFLPGGFLVAGGSVLILYSFYLTYLDAGLWPAAIHALVCLAVTPKLINWSLNRVALKQELTKEQGYVAHRDLSQYVGQHGVALGDLKPSGKIKLDAGEILDCITRSGFVDDGAPLIITASEAGCVIVTPEKNNQEKETGRET